MSLRLDADPGWGVAVASWQAMAGVANNAKMLLKGEVQAFPGRHADISQGKWTFQYACSAEMQLYQYPLQLMSTVVLQMKYSKIVLATFADNCRFSETVFSTSKVLGSCLCQPRVLQLSAYTFSQRYHEQYLIYFIVRIFSGAVYRELFDIQTRAMCRRC